jgi:predicted nucleotidyltransferase
VYTPEQRTRDLILGRLAQIETDHNVEMIFAVESGSRAWGFPSMDSDYDVRFVYRQRPREYMRLLRRPDTLGRPAKGALYDVTGWDVSKALTLGLKSNATLLEWLASPIRYRWGPEADELTMCVQRTSERKGLVYNYYNLARLGWDKLGTNTNVPLKDYFYTLRPALALRHMRMWPSLPPMNLQHLMDGTDLPQDCYLQTTELVATKAAGRELGTGPRLAALDAVIIHELQEAEATKPAKSQLAEDSTLLALAERTYFKLIGVPE